MTFWAEVTIKGSVLLAASLGLTLLMKRCCAATRHSVLVAGVIGLVVTPLAILVLPAWHVAPAVPTQRSLATTTPPLQSGTVDSQEPAGRPDPVLWNWTLAGVWLCGALGLILRLRVGSKRLHQIVKRSLPVTDGAWADAFAIVSRFYRLRRPTSLLLSESPAVLVTWGVFRPKVLLPADSENWPLERMRAVLCHELAHVRRADWLSQVGAEIVRAIFWFNPLIWVVCDRIRLESEYACDDSALRSGFAKSEYSEHLLHVVRALRQKELIRFGALGMARPSTLERRFLAMLNPGTHHHAASRAAILLVAVATGALTLPLAALSSTTAPSVAVTTLAVSEPGVRPVEIPAPEPLSPAAAPRAASAAPVQIQTAPDRNAYTGQPISLSLTDAPIRDFFRVIGDISGLSIILDPSVSGTVTILAKNLPWDQMLDAVLRNNDLIGQIEGNMLRINAKPAAIQTAQDSIALQFEFLRNGTLVAAPRVRVALPSDGASLKQNDLTIAVGATSRTAAGAVSTSIEVSVGSDKLMLVKLLLSPDQPGTMVWRTGPAGGQDDYELRVSMPRN